MRKRRKHPDKRKRKRKTPPLKPHLEKFCRAVADGYSNVEAAERAGRSRGSASYMWRQPGVQECVRELRQILSEEGQSRSNQKNQRSARVETIGEEEVIQHLAEIIRDKKERTSDRIRAIDIAMKSKPWRQLEAYGWSAAEIEKLHRTGALPDHFLRTINPLDSEFIRGATDNTFVWMTEHTKTKNEHWKEEGRPTCYEPLPNHPYLQDLFEAIEAEHVVWIEKSRDLMISWACVGYFTLNAMRVPGRGVIFQTQKQEKAIELIEYAKCLYREQDDRLKAAFPLAKPLNLQAANRLDFANDSYLVCIPGGANQIRSYHPWGYLNDESSFQADAGECYNEALSAVAGKIVFNSSAGVGWYADARKDINRN